MKLQMNASLADGYTSASQKIRVITETWLSECGYCPTCGSGLKSAKANAKVLDFECVNCVNEFELKSKRISKAMGKIADGAYSSMMERIIEPQSPHFFFLGYDAYLRVTDLMAVPNYFFQPSVIEKRNPLADTARRAGWIGCNILLDKIPEIGKIKLIKNGEIIAQEIVLQTWQRTTFLAQQNVIESRGWTLDLISCIERIKSKEFSLELLYKFESELAQKHPRNRFVKDKIRQQLQLLRDKGYLNFKGRGIYSLAE